MSRCGAPLICCPAGAPCWWLRPRFVEAHNNFGLTLAAEDKLAEAIAQFSEAKGLDPSFAPARNNLAIATVLQINPANAAARDALQKLTKKSTPRPGVGRPFRAAEACAPRRTNNSVRLHVDEPQCG